MRCIIKIVCELQRNYVPLLKQTVLKLMHVFTFSYNVECNFEFRRSIQHELLFVQYIECIVFCFILTSFVVMRNVILHKKISIFQKHLLLIFKKTYMIQISFNKGVKCLKLQNVQLLLHITKL